MSESKKRKYTKRDKEYWSNISKKSRTDAGYTSQNFNKTRSANENPFLNLTDEEWEPEATYNSVASVYESKGSCENGTSVTRTRRNRIAGDHMPHPYRNIYELELPYYSDKTLRGGVTINVREAVMLCQKAYAHIAVFRNAIDVMTEFSNADVYLKGGNKQSREFIEAWLNKIKLNQISEQFFREYFRSGNVFIYSFTGTFSPEDLRKIRKMYSDAAVKSEVPIRYTVLNPYDIIMEGSSLVGVNLYQKVLSHYELARLQIRTTPEDEAIYRSLPPEVRKDIDNGAWASDGITIKLERDRLSTAFYKKQDYEPFAIPFGYPVLKDLNHKLELKKIDQAIARVVQQVVLLVTMGEKDNDGLPRINKNAMKKIRELLENETVGRTIVSDYTTKMEFIMPDVKDILDPKKYEVINQDIQDGLQNLIFSTGEKFANQNTKVKVFLERLKEGRKIFLQNFLQPEIKRLCRDLGFKSYPKAYFEEVDLQDEVQFYRIWIRMLELGVLDPEQTIEAIRHGILPDTDELKEAQETYVKNRKKGWYNPLVGGVPVVSPPSNGESQPVRSGGPNPNASNNGRPAGSTGPKSTNSISPIGSGQQSNAHSLKGIKAAALDAGALMNRIGNFLAEASHFEELDETQKGFVWNIGEEIISTTDKKEWDNAFEEFKNDPEKWTALAMSHNTPNHNKLIAQEINDIISEHGVDKYQASLLFHSKMKVDKNDVISEV